MLPIDPFTTSCCLPSKLWIYLPSCCWAAVKFWLGIFYRAVFTLRQSVLSLPVQENEDTWLSFITHLPGLIGFWHLYGHLHFLYFFVMSIFPCSISLCGIRQHWVVTQGSLKVSEPPILVCVITCFNITVLTFWESCARHTQLSQALSFINWDWLLLCFMEYDTAL